MSQRTDNAIKNHFYSTLRRSLRRLNKCLGDKNSTAQVKDIKPGVLSKIMNLSERNPNSVSDGNLKKLMLSAKNIQDCLLEYANSKPVKKLFASDGSKNIPDINNPKAFKDLINHIFEFNKSYKVQREKRLKEKKKIMNNKIQVKVEHVPKVTKPTTQFKRNKEQASSALTENLQLDKCSRSIMNKIVKRNSNIFKIIRADFQVKTEPKDESSVTIVKKEYICETNNDSHYEPEHKPSDERGILESLEFIAKHFNQDHCLKKYISYKQPDAFDELHMPFDESNRRSENHGMPPISSMDYFTLPFISASQHQHQGPSYDESNLPHSNYFQPLVLKESSRQFIDFSPKNFGAPSISPMFSSKNRNLPMSFLTPKGLRSAKHEDGFADENIPFFSSNSKMHQRVHENQENMEFDKKFDYETSQFRIPIIKQENETDVVAWKADPKMFTRGLNLDLDLINDSYFEFRK